MSATAMIDHHVELRDVTVRYGGQTALKHFNLRVSSGEFLTVTGHNGSGKSTVVRTLAGLVSPDRGSVWISGADVTRKPAQLRDVAVMYRNYGFFTEMTVAGNIAYALGGRGYDRAALDERVAALLRLVRLEGQGHREVFELSIGEQQRANLARALAMRAPVMFLYEPLSYVDADLRRQIGEDLRRQQRRSGVTVVMATRDRLDAFRMSDRVAVLRNGELEQVGEPQEVYKFPRTPFVARVTGEANLLEGTVSEAVPSMGHVVVTTQLGDLTCVGEADPGDAVDVLIRPEEVAVVDPGSSALVGRLSGAVYCGSHWMSTVQVRGVELSVMQSTSSPNTPRVSEVVGLSFDKQYCYAMRRTA
jgi:putative spermidine/putrescine transport system ATP-binding protein